MDASPMCHLGNHCLRLTHLAFVEKMGIMKANRSHQPVRNTSASVGGGGVTPARILIVQEELTVAHNLKSRLEELGFIASTAASAEEAIRQVAEVQPDLVLMGIELHGKASGFQAGEQLRTCFDIPVVYLIARDGNTAFQDPKSTEAFGYVLQPLEIDELRSAIDRALHRSATENELRESEQRSGAAPDASEPKLVGGLLQQSDQALGQRVEERTVELARVNALLQQEIADRWTAEKRLVERASQLALINEIGTQIIAELDLDRLLDTATHLVQECFGYRHVSVFTIDRERQELVMRTKAGSYVSLFPSDYRLRLGQGIVGWVSRHGEKRLANDVGQDPHYINVFPGQMETRAELAVPIQIHDETIGVLDVQSPHVNAFDENDVMVIETVAGQIAVAMENAELYRSVRQELEQREQAEETLAQRARELRILNTLNHQIGASLSLDQVVMAALKGIDEAMAPDLALLYLKHEHGLRLLGIQPENRGLEGQILQVKGVEECLCGLAAGEAKPIYSSNIHTDPRCSLEVCKRAGMHSFAALPLFQGTSILGVLGLASAGVVDFSERAAFLEALAGEVALGLQNALLYEQVLGHAAELEQEVIERVQAQEALRESEKRFRSVFENTLVGLYRTTPDGQIIMANPALVHMLGYSTVGELAQRNLERGGYAPGYPRTVFKEMVEREGQVAGLESTWIKSDGSTLVVRESTRAIRDQAGRTLYYEGTVEDITERKQAEKALQLHAKRLETLHEVDQVILSGRSPGEIAKATLDHIGRLVSCQRASVHVLDPKTRQATILAVHADGETQLRAGAPMPFEPADSPMEADQQETRVVADILVSVADKDYRPVAMDRILLAEGMRSYASIPLVAQGEMIGILYLGSKSPGAFPSKDLQIAEEVARPLAIGLQQANLRERLERYAESLGETVVQRTRELQTERDRTQAILEAVGESVIVADTEGRVLYTNPATEILTGYSRSEALGQSAHLWLSGDRSAEIYRQIAGFLRHGRTWRGELASQRKDGSQYDAAVSATPLFDPDDGNRLIGSVWVQRDITPLKEAERLKDQFISNVSHELRTPLSIITLTADNLEAFYDRMDPAQHQQMLHSICEQVQVLDDLIGDVLQISRIDSGRISLERRPVDLAQLVRAEAEKHQPLAGEKDQSLRVACTESVVVHANDGQLRQVIRNLLHNAIKYTPKGGEIACECLLQTGQLVFDTREPGKEEDAAGPSTVGRWAVVRVIDTGIGISQENLPRIFERFHRINPESTISGTGLGLAIARDLVELHGGHITVSSTPGKGSVFAVFLPLLEEEGS
jgi:PAS domain S-box-containing protein